MEMRLLMLWQTFLFVRMSKDPGRLLWCPNVRKEPEGPNRRLDPEGYGGQSSLMHSPRFFLDSFERELGRHVALALLRLVYIVFRRIYIYISSPGIEN